MVKDSCYIIMNRRGVVKMTKNPPFLSPNQVSIFITIEVPNTVFERPMFKGEIKVSEEEIDIIEELEFKLEKLKLGGE